MILVDTKVLSELVKLQPDFAPTAQVVGPRPAGAGLTVLEVVL